MHSKIYAKISNQKYAEICRNTIICIFPTNIDLKNKYAKICKNMQKYAKYVKHEVYMQNMQKYAFPT